MLINIDIDNIEDINYINNLNENKNDILKTALTIGIKSIEMSKTNMNGNSYYEPIKQLLETNNNKEEIDNISYMLKDLMNIKNNSSRKGKLGESLAINTLFKKYPDWIIQDTSHISHEGDIYMYSNNYGKILYEIKTYSTNVNQKEIIKFKNDIITTNCDYGIFISQTSGIVGKKLLDYEIYNNKILIYVSCGGLNGHGIEFGTEFLLCLINTGYKDKIHIIDNKQVNNLLNLLNSNMFELNDCINNFSRSKSQLQEIRSNINTQFDIMHKNLIEYETKGNIIYKNIIDIIKINCNNKSNIIFNVNTIQNLILSLKEDFKNLFINIKDKTNVVWGINNNEIYIFKNETIIYKFIVDNNIKCIYYNTNNCISLNLEYEYIENNNVIMIINQYNDIIESIIINKINNF